MKQKLYKIFFSDYEAKHSEAIEDWKKTANNLSQEKWKYIVQVKELEDELEILKDSPKPTLADLMRENLKLITVDFNNQIEGIPKHFLDLPDTLDGREKRNLYIGQLHQIQGLDVWPVMVKNFIDIQGNFSFRLALTELEIFAGRMQVGGISLMRDAVKNGYDEYLERSKPKEEFDPTDNSTEGIPYSSDQKDDE